MYHLGSIILLGEASYVGHSVGASTLPNTSEPNKKTKENAETKNALTVSILPIYLASNCAENSDVLQQIEREISLCQDVLVNTCEEFAVMVKCLTNVKERACHLVDMPSFEYDLNAFLIKTYKSVPFSSECPPYKKLRRNIFNLSTKRCSQNYITEEKAKKEKCSTIEKHNLVLQVKFKSR